MNSSSPNSTNIASRDCAYGCNTKIHWNNSANEYWEMLTNKKHVCPNRSSNNGNKSVVTSANSNINATMPKPTAYYNSNYNKKSWISKSNNNNNNIKQPMDNSLEILQGTSIDTIKKQYETLADLIKAYNGKTHGSQSHILANNFIEIIVYYEVPEGKKEEVKEKFDDFIRNERRSYSNSHGQQ